MKNVFSLMLILVLGVSGIYAQEVESDSTKSDTIKNSPWVITTRNKKIVITERSDKDKKEEEAKESKSDTIKTTSLRKQRWNHYSGIDLGVNGFLNSAQSVDLEKEAEFMDLDYGKSFSIAVNFMEFYIPIAKEKLGIMTGAGFEFNNYALVRSVSMFADKDTTMGVVDDTKNIDNNRFKTTMLNLPLLLETNIGKDAKHSFHLAAGVMGSMRVGSKTKQEFSQSGKDYKVKNRTDFNMNPWRVNAMVRVGYGDFTLFASYSLTPIFDKDKGPELYPFTVGISLASF